MTGLEVIRAIGSGELPGAPIAEPIGFEPMEADEGQREDGQLLAHGTTTCLVGCANGTAS
jgi:hypothetical protein